VRGIFIDIESENLVPLQQQQKHSSCRTFTADIFKNELNQLLIVVVGEILMKCKTRFEGN
jgi:hypothetical protein